MVIVVMVVVIVTAASIMRRPIIPGGLFATDPPAKGAPGHPQSEEADGAVADDFQRGGLGQDLVAADIEHRRQQTDQHDGGEGLHQRRRPAHRQAMG